MRQHAGQRGGGRQQRRGAGAGRGLRLLFHAASQSRRRAAGVDLLAPSQHAVGWHRAVAGRRGARRHARARAPRRGRRHGVDLSAWLVATWRAALRERSRGSLAPVRAAWPRVFRPAPGNGTFQWPRVFRPACANRDHGRPSRAPRRRRGGPAAVDSRDGDLGVHQPDPPRDVLHARGPLVPGLRRPRHRRLSRPGARHRARPLPGAGRTRSGHRGRFRHRLRRGDGDRRGLGRDADAAHRAGHARGRGLPVGARVRVVSHGQRTACPPVLLSAAQPRLLAGTGRAAAARRHQPRRPDCRRGLDARLRRPVLDEPRLRRRRRELRRQHRLRPRVPPAAQRPVGRRGRRRLRSRRRVPRARRQGRSRRG